MSTKGECRGGSCLGFTSHVGMWSCVRMSYVVGDDSTEWDLFHVVCHCISSFCSGVSSASGLQMQHVLEYDSSL